MYVIAIAAVTAGGKTSVVNELKCKFRNTRTLHFDDYSFEEEVVNFYQWVLDGADYSVWNLEPLKEDIQTIAQNGDCELLILDYPFAYCHPLISPYIDLAVFIDTPLDIALARRILRDFENASIQEIRSDLQYYLDFARIAYLQMHRDILPSCNFVVDGTLPLSVIVEKIANRIMQLEGLL